MAPINSANVGFWDPMTSTLDWCESNYEVSYYVAEFWNTVSNIIYFIPPLLTYYRLRGQKLAKNQAGILMMYLILTIVGCGSILFHGTLKYTTQLMDEIPMLFGISYGLYLIMVLYYPASEELIRMVLAALAISSSLIYILVVYPIFFQVTFTGETLLLTYYHLRSLRDLNGDPKMVFSFLLFNVLAFAFWNVDNIFCEQLEALRAALHPVLLPFTQLHALWHIFSGIGFYSIANHLLFLHLRKINPKCTFNWDIFGLAFVS